MALFWRWRGRRGARRPRTRRISRGAARPTRQLCNCRAPKVVSFTLNLVMFRFGEMEGGNEGMKYE